MEFENKKLFAAAILFAVVAVGSFVFLSNFSELAKAQGTSKITGTIVLSDDLKFYGYYNQTAGNAYEVTSNLTNSNVALPGTDNCAVKVTGCCTDSLFSSCGVQTFVTVSVGTISKQSTNTNCTPACETASGTLAGGNLYDVQLNCTSGQTVPTYLAVSYACDVPVP